MVSKLKRDQSSPARGFSTPVTCYIAFLVDPYGALNRVRVGFQLKQKPRHMPPYG
jgi:hypothetical protein